MYKGYWYNKIIESCPTEFLLEHTDLEYEETQLMSIEDEKECIFKILDKLTEKQVEEFIDTH